MTDDVRHLLSGYATGNLKHEERNALFAAALQDQKLFEALADEQALKELLDEPMARAAVLRATEEPRFSLRSAFLEWLQKPVAKGLIATGLILLSAIVVRTALDTPAQQSEPQMAKFERPSLTLSTEQPQSQAPPMRSLAKKRAEVPKPPAAASAPVTPPIQAAVKNDSSVEYAVLLRDSSGGLRPVSPDTVFEKDAELRLQVKANQLGHLRVTADGDRQLFDGRVSPGVALVMPSDGFLKLEKIGVDTVHIAFTHVQVVDTLRDFRAGAAAFREEERREAVQAPSPAPPSPPTVSIEISLKHK